MSALHASPSPSPSPAPANNTNSNANNVNNGTQNKATTRASMGPQSRPSGGSPALALPSPRPGGQSGGGRPTSELLAGGGGAAMFQTPEAEAIDQWFENLQNYEVTLEEMAAASLDVNFKEELSAIEQWFRVLSEAERTAALYSLLQQSTQVQIRFFITVLQQMARSDPMTALLSPAVGGSMQSQMEAKLATLGIKSPALGGSFPSPASPSARNFGRQSLAADSPAFLSPDTAANSGNNDAAATLAQQRAKLNKANAAHRISAPALANSAGNVWSSASVGAKQLGQVAEQEQPSPTLQPPPSGGSARPKSMDLSSLSNLRSPRAATTTVSTDDTNDVPISPAVGGNWASMVNTPAVPMFDQDSARSQNNLDAAAMKLQGWGANNLNSNANGNTNRFVLDDPKSHRRASKGALGGTSGIGKNSGNDSKNAGVIPDDNNLLPQNQPGNVQRGSRSFGANPGGIGNWSGARSPSLSSGRFSDSGGTNDMNLGGAGFGLGSPGMMNMNMMGMGGMGGMGMPGFNMGMLNQMANLNALAAAGLTPEAQAFAAQMTLLGGQPGMMGGLAGFGAMGAGPGFRSPNSGRHGSSTRSGTDRRSSVRTGGGDKPDEEIDPTLLEDVPAWLRSLRLHKYTPNFEGMTWRQMVTLNEEQLEAKGVAALGARRKMLKTFEQVRNKMGVVTEPAA